MTKLPDPFISFAITWGVLAPLALYLDRFAPYWSNFARRYWHRILLNFLITGLTIYATVTLSGHETWMYYVMIGVSSVSVVQSILALIVLPLRECDACECGRSFLVAYPCLQYGLWILNTGILGYHLLFMVNPLIVIGFAFYELILLSLFIASEGAVNQELGYHALPEPAQNMV